LNRSLPSRTSLGLTARVGWKRYVFAAAGRATLWELALRGAQALSPVFGVRGWVTHSQLLEYADASAELAAFENPLLDAFSADGTRYGAALKARLPARWTLDLEFERLRCAFPGRPPTAYDPTEGAFIVDATDQLVLNEGVRRDSSVMARLSAQKQILSGRGSRQISLRASVEWSDQGSNDLYWVWSGWSCTGGVSLAL
jgi:hypothetical protein